MQEADVYHLTLGTETRTWHVLLAPQLSKWWKPPVTRWAFRFHAQGGRQTKGERGITNQLFGQGNSAYCPWLIPGLGGGAVTNLARLSRPKPPRVPPTGVLTSESREKNRGSFTVFSTPASPRDLGAAGAWAYQTPPTKNNNSRGREVLQIRLWSVRESRRLERVRFGWPV